MVVGSDLELFGWVVIWLVASLAILLRHWRAESGSGLLFTYVLTFGVLHGLVPLLYLLPWYERSRFDLTAAGMRESAIAIVAFAIGAELMALWLRQRHGEALVAGEETPPADARLVNLYLTVGIVLYGVIFPLANRLPTVTALVATGSSIIVAGLALKCWNSWLDEHPGRTVFWLMVSSTLPIVTVMTQGFLGYGFAGTLTVFAFVASFYRPRWLVAALGVIVCYVGMSVYVTYMRDRRDIRSVVWTGAGYGDRVDRVVETFSNGEWFDLENEAHLDRVDDRLNQDFLIGAAVVYIESGQVPFAHGETIRDAAIALVPRAVWPEKPVVAGSGDLVSGFTGIQFAEGTSVGIGQVLEWYVNFGTTGVVVGFVLIGGVVLLVERSATRWLRAGDVRRFTMWYLPGLSLLLVGGSLVELTSSAAAAWVMAVLLAYGSRRVLGDQPLLSSSAGVSVQVEQPEEPA